MLFFELDAYKYKNIILKKCDNKLNHNKKNVSINLKRMISKLT